MKLKKFKLNEDIASGLLTAGIVIGTITGSILFYQYENKEQICEVNMDEENMFIGEDGEIYCYFDVGEHIIKISRNDTYCYKGEKVDGYVIKDVEINSWKDNNKITYVNKKPVIVKATKSKKGKIEFNDFGVVSNEKIILKDINNRF